MTDLASGNLLKYIKTAFEQQLAITVAAMNLPFFAVENHQFCKMLCMLQADVKLSGRKQVKVLLEQRYDQIVADHFQDLGVTAKVPLTINF